MTVRCEVENVWVMREEGGVLVMGREGSGSAVVLEGPVDGGIFS